MLAQLLLTMMALPASTILKPAKWDAGVCVWCVCAGEGRGGSPAPPAAACRCPPCPPCGPLPAVHSSCHHLCPGAALPAPSLGSAARTPLPPSLPPLHGSPPSPRNPENWFMAASRSRHAWWNAAMISMSTMNLRCTAGGCAPEHAGRPRPAGRCELPPPKPGRRALRSLHGVGAAASRVCTHRTAERRSTHLLVLVKPALAAAAAAGLAVLAGAEAATEAGPAPFRLADGCRRTRRGRRLVSASSRVLGGTRGT